MWSDDQLIKHYEPRKGDNIIDWDRIYQDFIDWTGRNINDKIAWMNGGAIIPIKLDPSPKDQVQDPNIYTPWEYGNITLKQVFHGRPSPRKLRTVVQWSQSEHLIFNKTGVVLKSWTQHQ